MKTRHLLIFAVIFLCCLSSRTTAQSLLNKIRLDQCNPYKTRDAELEFDSDSLLNLIESEGKRGLILDARPFAINQATGKLRFNGKTGRVSVVHMNPFVYRYNISVAQEELVSSAVSDFIDILLPPALRSIGKVQTGEAKLATIVPSDVKAIEERLQDFDCANRADAGCAALTTMKAEFDQIKTAINSHFATLTGDLPAEISTLAAQISELRDEQADAYTTCVRAQKVNEDIANHKPASHVSALETTEKKLEDTALLARDLTKLVDEYFADDGLKNYPARCGGFNCARQFNAYAEAVLNVLSNVYQPILSNRLETERQLKAMLDLTEKMKQKEGLFARTFEVIKKFELTETTVSVARIRPETREGEKKTPEATTTSTRKTDQAGSSGAFANTKEDDRKEDDEKDATEDEKAKDDPKPDPSKALAADINESIQIGRPRFLISGGLVYSPLPRQTFESTTGFSRDAQGNPVGDSNKSVVGFGENSPRRLMPMVFLNSRLASFSPASIYFSLGVTAKHDRDIDVEYLIGPSVSMLNERAMFTFGAYAGKTARLVPDVKIGDEIPEDAGDAILFTKRYTWKPGFSFSYVFSNVSKGSQEGTSGGIRGGSTIAADEFKDEIRIGDIPFNLAMGLAYTSLEDRTFDEVLGVARDRQGNLTNGQTLTRTVGLSTVSNYRLVPLAMLHTRLLNFGRHSFYFTSGVTGKKDSDEVEIEYLLGGSINVYKRKLFFTFGTFAGKHQVLGGDLFLGGKLNPTQNVTTESRYVWKPAFAVSYDISRILPKSVKR